MTETLTIEDLEKHSGLSIRTLRYYMAKGLLPGPDTLGKYASYSQEHLDRLDMIMYLKETMNMPLDEIGELLNRMTHEEVLEYLKVQKEQMKKIKSTKPEQGTPLQKSSALDYIKSLEEAHTTHREIAESQYLFRNNQKAFSQAAPAQESPPSSEERWRRTVLADGVELHTRETRDKAKLRKIRRLISFARSIFERETTKGDQHE